MLSSSRSSLHSSSINAVFLSTTKPHTTDTRTPHRRSQALRERKIPHQHRQQPSKTAAGQLPVATLRMTKQREGRRLPICSPPRVWRRIYGLACCSSASRSPSAEEGTHRSDLYSKRYKQLSGGEFLELSPLVNRVPRQLPLLRSTFSHFFLYSMPGYISISERRAREPRAATETPPATGSRSGSHGTHGALKINHIRYIDSIGPGLLDAHPLPTGPPIPTV